MENKKAETLYQEMTKLPPDYNEVERIMCETGMSPEDIAVAMIELADACMFEDFDILDLEAERGVSPEKMEQCHSNHLIELTKIALRYGFDPDFEYDDNTFTKSICWIAIPYIAADLMNILLDAGADVTKSVDGESALEMLTDLVGFDAIEQSSRLRYDAIVHLWFVVLGSGAEAPFIERVKDFDLKKLRNHRDYDFCLVYAPNCCGDKWSLRIFDKYERWEVGVF